MTTISQEQKDYINNILVAYLDEQHLKIVDLKFAKNQFMPESTTPILYAVIKNLQDKKVTVRQISKIAKILNVQLDESRLFSNLEFGIDVSSVGAEQPIKTIVELSANINKSINVTMNDHEVYEGKLLEVISNTFVIEINIKDRLKKITLDYGSSSHIRQALAVPKEK